MPTVLHDVEGFDVIIHTRDEHNPPHVHVRKGEHEATINLGEGTNDPSLDEVSGMSKADARKALEMVTDKKDMLRTRWNQIWKALHG